MRIELKALRERVPTTSVYVTHDQVEAMTLGDRVVVMKDGWIQQVGTPLDIYNRPATRFVASFMGAPAMNFIDVELVEVQGGLRARARNFDICIQPQQAERLREHGVQAITMGVRPEHIHLGAASGEAGSTFSGQVMVTEQLGSELVVGVNAADVTIMASRIAPDTEIGPHAPVEMWVERRALHFFDRKTEAAIR